MTDAKPSVLASLTAAVMDEKKAAAKQLTPVAGEFVPPKVRVPDVPGDFLTDEGLADVSRDLRKYATDLIRHGEYLQKVAEGIDKMHGYEQASEGVVDLEAERKQKEFEADLRAKAQAAQAATFQSAEGASPVSEASEAEATDETALDDRNQQPVWTCSVHNKPGIEKTSTRTGRKFIGCPDCNQFAR